MNTLFFEKISKFNRTEPVTVGMPFPRGELCDPAAFRLMDGDTPLFCQTSVTGTWPDGSVKWLFVRSKVELPGNASKQFHFKTDESLPLPELAEKVMIKKTDNGSLNVDTGSISLTIPARGIWPVKNVCLNGKQIWDKDSFRGLKMTFGEIEHTSRELPVNLTIEESGPMRAVVRIDAKITESNLQYPAIRSRLTFWAGLPYFTFRYTVTSRREDFGNFIEVKDWTLDLKPIGSNPTLRVAVGSYRDLVIRNSDSNQSAEFRFNTEFLKADVFEHQADSFSHNSWADWESDWGGVMVSVRNAAQNYPKGYSVIPDHMTIELYPPSEDEPLECMSAKVGWISSFSP